jgi:hypothetical protein
MKRLTLAALLLALLVFVALPAQADDTWFVGLNGSGSLLLNAPDYVGTFMFGMSGTWTIEIDDSLWPAPGATNPTRFEYIWDTFFAPNYDNTPGAKAWYGTFDGLTLPSTPQFVFETTSPAGSLLAGDITFRIMVRDSNGNAVLDTDEKYANQNFNATLSVNPDLGTGYFMISCGHGSIASGNFNFVDPPGVDVLQITGQIQTYPCPSPVQETSWGTIKAIYSE